MNASSLHRVRGAYPWRRRRPRCATADRPTHAGRNRARAWASAAANSAAHAPTPHDIDAPLRLPTRARCVGMRWTARFDAPSAGGPSRTTSRLERGDVDGLGPLVARLGVEGDPRTLSQRLEAVGVDAGVVNEEVLATVVRRDEAEALVVVEPLDGSGSHDFPPRRMCTANAEEAAMATTAALNTLSSSAARPT